jgi:hypothetical protein
MEAACAIHTRVEHPRPCVVAFLTRDLRCMFCSTLRICGVLLCAQRQLRQQSVQRVGKCGPLALRGSLIFCRSCTYLMRWCCCCFLWWYPLLAVCSARLACTAQVPWGHCHQLTVYNVAEARVTRTVRQVPVAMACRRMLVSTAQLAGTAISQVTGSGTQATC